MAYAAQKFPTLALTCLNKSDVREEIIVVFLASFVVSSAFYDPIRLYDTNLKICCVVSKHLRISLDRAVLQTGVFQPFVRAVQWK
jgi:hypothetical protein